jgi:hypothetical protein
MSDEFTPNALSIPSLISFNLLYAGDGGSHATLCS